MNPGAGTVRTVERAVGLAPVQRDAEARVWIAALQGGGPDRERAAAELHGLLLEAARFELARRHRAGMALSRETIDDLAMQSADDALSAILGKLDGYRFESRFTTWAYKLAILEAATRARRRAWQTRELPVDTEAWAAVPSPLREPGQDVETRELLRATMTAIRTELSPHRREVLGALVLAEVPIDVLAERLGTTRGALYKTLHDARRKLRAVVGANS